MGKYQDVAGASDCTACAAGRYNTYDSSAGNKEFHDESTDCQPCPDGEFANEARTKCSSCGAGHFVDSSTGVCKNWFVQLLAAWFIILYCTIFDQLMRSPVVPL